MLLLGLLCYVLVNISTCGSKWSCALELGCSLWQFMSSSFPLSVKSCMPYVFYLSNTNYNELQPELLLQKMLQFSILWRMDQWIELIMFLHGMVLQD